MANQTAQGATSVLQPENYQWIPFPIPGATGHLEAAILNADITLGAIVAVLRMPPGARIPAHYHQKSREEIYVLEGESINKGETYAAGAFFAIKPMDVHGPHETKNGCLLMFTQSTEVDPTDFFIDESDPANRRQFRVEFAFHTAPPMSLIEKEYERLDELKAEGTFIALDLKPDKSGGILQMQGQSKDEVHKAVETLPLYPFATWNVFADKNDVRTLRERNIQTVLDQNEALVNGDAEGMRSLWADDAVYKSLFVMEPMPTDKAPQTLEGGATIVEYFSGIAKLEAPYAVD